MGSKHGGKFTGVFGVFALLEGAGDSAMVAAKFTSLINIVNFGPVNVRIFQLETSNFAIGEFETDFGSVAAVDRIANRNVFAQHLLHVAGIIIIDSLDDIAIIVFDIHVFDFLIFPALGGAESIVFFLGDFGVGFLVDANVLTPFAVFVGHALFVTVLRIFNYLAVFVFFKTIIINTGFVENHTAVVTFVDAEFSSNNTSFGAAAFLDFGTAFDNLAHDCRFAGVAKFTSRTSDETVEFVRITILVFGGAKVAAEEELLVALGDILGTELLAHDIEVGFAMGSA